MIEMNLTDPDVNPVSVTKGTGESKCTRCGRTIKNIFIVEGADYGPICVKKLFGIDVARGLPTQASTVKAATEPSADQPAIFEETE